MFCIISFIAGGLFGVVFMCLFQINRYETEREYRTEQSGAENGKGEYDASAGRTI